MSFAARITFSLLKIINFKKLVEKSAKKAQKRPKSFAPKRILSRYKTVERSVSGHKIATFERKEEGGIPLRHIIYFHGGAYIFGASAGHWSLLEKIVDRGDFRISVLDYPLSPEKTYRETYEMISNSYSELVKSYPKNNFILMGDSAGAALAMGFCQKLIADKRFEELTNCVLISPWLDLTMSNPNISQYIDRDFILTLDLLHYAAKIYSDGDDPNQYLLSPINGEIEAFPSTLVLYASEEIFKPDCELLSKKAKEQAAPFEFSEFEGMQHAWPVLPVPEQKTAVDQILKFLEESEYE